MRGCSCPSRSPARCGCAIDRHLALRWLLSLSIGMALVGASKILYAGCGIEISSVRFRVISGHTMLAAAVWTVAFALLALSANARWHRAGRGARPHARGAGRPDAESAEDAHTPIEVLAGWPLGGGVAVLFLNRFTREPRRMPQAILAGLGLLAVSSIAYGHHAPFQRMIVHYSPWLCRGFGL